MIDFVHDLIFGKSMLDYIMDNIVWILLIGVILTLAASAIVRWRSLPSVEEIVDSLLPKKKGGAE